MKNNLLQRGESSYALSLDLIMVQPKGQTSFTVLDCAECLLGDAHTQLPSGKPETNSPVRDVFEILVSLLNTRNNTVKSPTNSSKLLRENMISTPLSQTFHAFFCEFRKLAENKFDLAAWNLLMRSPLLRLKFKRQQIEGLYSEVTKAQGSLTDLLNPRFGGIKELAKNPENLRKNLLENSLFIIPREIKWKKGNYQSSSQTLNIGLKNAFDSSGGSNGLDRSQLDQKKVINPSIGGQESTSVLNNQKSRLFIEACREVIGKHIEQNKQSSGSNFLINSLINLELTLVSCESSEPNKSIELLRLVSGEKID